ncbi:MAG TPA: glycosyltransferase [Dehalococcoidia bacterium]|nr:glycosyltransferase [Dehalococcoidia bacterium]
MRRPFEVLGLASLGAWLYLLFGRGRFWQAGPRLPNDPPPSRWPRLAVVVPARNEAQVLPLTLPTLLSQDYPGDWHLYLVDDASGDGTGLIAQQIGRQVGEEGRLTVVQGRPTPPGWSGKVWAMAQGVAEATPFRPDYLLFTDADIVHPSDGLRRLVSLAEARVLDLASVMVLLRTEGFWERLLMPAFVYFFAKLYPFRWAAEPRRATAGAAGGCMLVRWSALQRAGGLEAIAGAVIDDCSLAAAIKASGGRLWLGLSRDWRSVRGYSGLRGVGEMVARSAYAQLRYSPLLLLATVVGMVLAYGVPPALALWGLARRRRAAAALGLATWGLMSASYLPMLRWFRLSPLWAPLLPAAALLYVLFTIDSAQRWHRGYGVEWRGRRTGPVPTLAARPYSGR